MKKKFAIFSLSIALILGMILLSVGQQPMLLPGFNLTDLIDVDAATPANGYVIIWDSATGKWIPASSGGGAGDVIGPGSSTDNAIVRFDGTTGKIVQDSGITIDDSDNLTMPAATHLVLPLHNDAATPTLAFGDGDCGVYQSADGRLDFTTNGTARWYMNISFLQGSLGSSGALINETASATNPTISPRGASDPDTGLGASGNNQLSLIAGGVEGIRLTESTGVLQTHQLTAGITADVGSAQGDGALVSSYNEISVCANPGDAVTLPSASAGIKVTIINNGANAADVFPASGDDCGGGADTAVSLAAGSNITYMAIDATTWEVI